MENIYQNKEGLLNETGAQVNQAQAPQNNVLPGMQATIPQGGNGSNKEPSVRKTYPKPDEVTEEMKKNYTAIFNAYGADAANEWIKGQLVDNYKKLEADNDAVIREIQEKYAELYTVPAVREAMQAYIDMDLNPSISLRDQEFHRVADYLSSVYRAGYESGSGLKAENDSAKLRMTSAVNSTVPHQQSGRVFTRADIKAMSPDEFLRNEKAIFDQLNRGLIK